MAIKFKNRVTPIIEDVNVYYLNMTFSHADTTFETESRIRFEEKDVGKLEELYKDLNSPNSYRTSTRKYYGNLLKEIQEKWEGLETHWHREVTGAWGNDFATIEDLWITYVDGDGIEYYCEVTY